MLSLSGDTAGLVSHLEKNSGDYRGTEQAAFRLDRGRGGGGERSGDRMMGLIERLQRGWSCE